jgi:hypothetical protein
MNTDVGFKEANLVHAASCIFWRHGFSFFPEFPYAKGSVDTLFVRKNEVVIAEFKRMHRSMLDTIVSQTERMEQFDPHSELEKHCFKTRKWKLSLLWLCDAWDKESVDWWMGPAKDLMPKCQFGRSWSKGSEDLRADLGKHPDNWSPYSILWAYREKVLSSR